ncbi:hypothetical protein [Phenylobacterium sp.]|uniref:hypothetical protein n=1 Tax=Phenylobacterium sp. TaxID=1871053 RepID=UPI00301C86B5
MFQTPSPVHLAAGAAFATVGLMLAGCDRGAEPAPPAAPQAQAQAPATPSVPLPPPAVGRGDLLTVMEAAASDHAAGRAPEGQPLAGRRFTVRQAFGCGEPSASSPDDPAGDGIAHWSWGPERRTVDIRLRPADWKDSALVEAAADLEAVEGFWLARPWLRAEGCPDVRVDPVVGQARETSPQTMGLAAVLEPGGSRLGRRGGRAYSFTVRGIGDQPAPAPIGGYRLVLEGRFTTFSDGRVVHCRAESPDQRPTCVAAAQLDRVAFETAQGVVLSEWRLG